VHRQADSSSKCNSSWFVCVPHFHAEEYLIYHKTHLQSARYSSSRVRILAWVGGAQDSVFDLIE